MRRFIYCCLIGCLAFILSIGFTACSDSLTVSKIMKMESPEQIEKIELAFCGGDAEGITVSYPPFYSLINERTDITETELGKEYADLLFSLPVKELSGEDAYPSYFTMGYPKFYAIILTIDDPDYIYGAQEYILPVDPLPEYADKPAFMSVNLKLRTAGYEEHIFTLPQHEYFTASFIKDHL